MDTFVFWPLYSFKGVIFYLPYISILLLEFDVSNFTIVILVLALFQNFTPKFLHLVFSLSAYLWQPLRTTLICILSSQHSQFCLHPW